MARINLEEQFWDEIIDVAAKIGSKKQAIGEAVLLFRIAQHRAKEGRIITDEDWKIHGFHPALVPIFAQKVDGGYAVRGAEKHFKWLVKRKKDASKGGRVSAAKRRSKNKDLAVLDPSKRKQTQPSSSISSSSSSSLEKPSNEGLRGSASEPSTPSESVPKVFHWLAELWNEVLEANPDKSQRLKRADKWLKTSKKTGRSFKINARLRERPDRGEWKEIFQRIVESDFLAGRTKSWRASFDWILNENNVQKVVEGNYDNENKVNSGIEATLAAIRRED